jgi:hypothetical protein
MERPDLPFEGTSTSAVEYRRFGRTTRQVPVIGQGTWFINNEDRVQAIVALRKGSTWA